MTINEFDYNGNTFTRISKNAARNILRDEPNQYILMLTNKMNPFSPWTNVIVINGNLLTKNNYDFDKYVNSYEYYNCNYAQGDYATFYTQKEGTK